LTTTPPVPEPFHPGKSDRRVAFREFRARQIGCGGKSNDRSYIVLKRSSPTELSPVAIATAQGVRMRRGILLVRYKYIGRSDGTANGPRRIFLYGCERISTGYLVGSYYATKRGGGLHVDVRTPRPELNIQRAIDATITFGEL